MKKMIEENKGKLVLSSLVILLPGILGWRLLWETVALLAAHWLCLLLVFADRRNREGQSKKAVGLIFWLMPGLSLFLGAAAAVAQRGEGRGMLGVLMSFGFGLMFLLIGNYMPKFRQNHTVGIRVKWTLENEENWNVTHRFGGKVWVAAGLACMICPLLPPSAMAVVFPAAIVAGALTPCVYSWLYYKKQLRQGTAVRVVYTKKQKAISALITLALAAFVLWVLFAGSMEVVFGETSFTVETPCWNDLTVSYADVDSVEYLPGDAAPEAGMRTYGFGNLRMQMGSFANDAFGDYTRYAYASCGACVVLETKGRIVVLNGPDDTATEVLYETLAAKIAAQKATGWGSGG